MSAVKKVIKKVGKFFKKHWKKIVLAAAVVFTAGMATVGTAGFATAMSTAGGGVGGFLSAAGQTMVAGVTSIGGTLGMGQGANLAAFGGSGYATLGTGAAAQALGFAAPGASSTAGAIASGAASAPAAGGAASGVAGSGAGLMSGGGVPYATGAGLQAAGVAPVAETTSFGIPALGTGGAEAATTAAAIPSASVPAASVPAAAIPSAPAAAAPAAGGSFLMSPTGAALVSATAQGLSAYMQARALEDQEDENDPKALYGVDLQGNDSISPDQIRKIMPTQAYASDTWKRNAVPTRVA